MALNGGGAGIREPVPLQRTLKGLHVLVSLAFQPPYGNEDFRLLGDTNRVFSLPIDCYRKSTYDGFFLLR